MERNGNLWNRQHIIPATKNSSAQSCAVKTSKLVQLELSLLFGPGNLPADELVNKIPTRVLEDYKQAFQELESLERVLFGDKSFFFFRKHNILPVMGNARVQGQDTWEPRAGP